MHDTCVSSDDDGVGVIVTFHNAIQDALKNRVVRDVQCRTRLLPRMSGRGCDHCRLLGNVTRPVRRGPRNGPVGRRPDAGKKGDAKRRPADPMCPDEDDLEPPGTSVPIAGVTRNTRRRIPGCHLLRSSLVHWITPEGTQCSPTYKVMATDADKIKKIVHQIDKLFSKNYIDIIQLITQAHKKKKVSDRPVLAI